MALALISDGKMLTKLISERGRRLTDGYRAVERRFVSGKPS